MELRLEFVLLAMKDGANMSALCRRFGISRTTGYKWLRRYREDGTDGLKDRSRRPHSSPNKTPAHIEAAICEVRRAQSRRNPCAWGGRKIRSVVQGRAARGALPFAPGAVPAASTCQTILQRNGLIDPKDASKHRAYERFEKDAPNELWQMDFKGHFALTGGGRCHPFTLLDDHSRFALGLQACPDEQKKTVQGHLETAFRRYGLPRRILCDNGQPWGVGASAAASTRHYTQLEAWLMRLGVRVSHSRPAHPETHGKIERFHRTLEAEVLRYASFGRLAGCQPRFDQWRATYNFERPHEAVRAADGSMDVPGNRYAPSPRPFPEPIEPVTYGPGDTVRKVVSTGKISFHGDDYRVGKAFRGHPVALRPTSTDGIWTVYFCDQQIKTLDLRSPPNQDQSVCEPVNHVPERV